MTVIAAMLPTSDPFFSAVRTTLARSNTITAVLSPFDGLAAHRVAYARRRRPPLRERPSEFLPTLYALRTSDRVFLRPLPVNELLNYYWWLEELCEQYLSSLPPGSVLLWPASPHFPWDLTLTQVAERLNHRVVTLEATHLPNRIAAYEGSEFDDPQYLQDSAPRSRGTDNHANGESVRLRDSKATNFESQSVGGSLRRTIRKLVWSAAKAARGPHASTTSYWSIYSYPEKTSFALRALSQHRNLRREVKRFERSEPLPSDYALISLHYQPERTTDPDAGCWRNQDVFVAAVRAVLDTAGRSGTRLLVKEHPRQAPKGFPDLRQLHYRHATLYKTIREIRGADLVPTMNDLESLARGASLVASANGSIAWTGLALGIPTLTARRSWFSDCQATVSLKEARNNPALLKSILEMDPLDVVEALEHWRAAERVTFPGLTMSRHLADGSSRRLAAQMGEALTDRLSR